MPAQKTLCLITPTIILIAVFALWSCQSEQPSKGDPADNVEVQWAWKRTVKGETNYIYGAVKNKQDKALQQIVLQFCTQDKQGKTLYKRNFTLNNLPAHSQKLFAEDYPVHAQEDSGFVTVKKVTLAE